MSRTREETDDHRCSSKSQRGWVSMAMCEILELWCGGIPACHSELGRTSYNYLKTSIRLVLTRSLQSKLQNTGIVGSTISFIIRTGRASSYRQWSSDRDRPSSSYWLVSSGSGDLIRALPRGEFATSIVRLARTHNSPLSADRTRVSTEWPARLEVQRRTSCPAHLTSCILTANRLGSDPRSGLPRQSACGERYRPQRSIRSPRLDDRASGT